MTGYRNKFKQHLPGHVAGDFLCKLDPQAGVEAHRSTIHLEMSVEDIVKHTTSEVCTKCLQLKLLRVLSGKDIREQP